MNITDALYIGADNQTGEIDISRVESIVAKDHDAFTVIPAIGSWRGNSEPSAVVIVSDTPESIERTITALKSELQQDAIGVEELPDIQLA